MNKKIFGLSFLILFSAIEISFAQTESPDSTAVQWQKVLLIPYRPSMYFSNCDADMAEASGMPREDMALTFQLQLQKNLERELGKIFEVTTLLPGRDSTMDAMLSYIYKNTGYKLTEEDEEKSEVNERKIENVFKGKKNETPKYMEIVVHDPSMFQTLFSAFGATFVLFINQFDIITNFDSCVDVGNHIYKRSIRVHYTLFDKNGKRVYGRTASVEFTSDMNNVKDIVNGNFPYIIQQISSHVK